jgi:hypothetical protein
MKLNNVNSVQKLCDFIMLTCCKKSREIPEDAVEKHENVSELKLISLKRLALIFA